MKLRAVIAEAVEQALQQQSNQASPKAWMAPWEAADYLRCTTQHLQMLRARRTGPSFVKFGRLIRYAREDLDTYLSERKVETDS